MMTSRQTRDNEDGFTLIEILVVIIIIGILAAIAIPIFLNQQRAARDSATVADVKNLVTNIETQKVTNNQTKVFVINHYESALQPEDTSYVLTVGEPKHGNHQNVTKTAGTMLTVRGVPAEGEDRHSGEYIIEAWNPDGGEYRPGNHLVYDSSQGGFTN